MFMFLESVSVQVTGVLSFYELVPIVYIDSAMFLEIAMNYVAMIYVYEVLHI